MRTRTIELWMVIFKVGVTRETNLLVSALDSLLSISAWCVCKMDDPAIFLTCCELQHVLYTQLKK